jgi:transcriptional regulator with XRE-family HTH domain
MGQVQENWLLVLFSKDEQTTFPYNMTTTDLARLGARIRSLRTARGMPLTELAERASISKGYVSQLEGGSGANPTLDVLMRIAEALDVTIADLIHAPKAKPAVELPKALPPGLEELVKEYRAAGRPLDDETVAWLANARFRGGTKTKDDFAFLVRWLRTKG